MNIHHVYERNDIFVVFAGEETIGLHHEKSSEEGKYIFDYLKAHPEALIDEPQPPEPTSEELAARKVAEAKAYLASTDWIVAKIGEAQMQGKSIATLLTKYNAELVKRAAARVTINGA